MSILRFVSSLMNPAVLANRLGRWSPLPLRLIVGYGFMAHGYANEPCKWRRLRTVLWAAGGEIPLADPAAVQDHPWESERSSCVTARACWV